MPLLDSAYVALVAVLILSGTGKLIDVNGFARTVSDYRILPKWGTRFAAYGVIAAELVASGMLAFPATRRAGAVLACLLFSAFLVGMLVVLRRGDTVDCGCFAGRMAETVSAGTAVRTGIVLLYAALTLPAEPASFDPVQIPFGFALLVLAFGAGAVVRKLARQRSPSYGPKPGSILRTGAPLEGLASSNGHGRILFAYISPQCPSCTTMLPELAARSTSLPVVLVSASDEAAVRQHLDEHGVDLPLVCGPDVFELGDVPGPPYAVLTDATGVVLAHSGANRPDQIETLLRH